MHLPAPLATQDLGGLSTTTGVMPSVISPTSGQQQQQLSVDQHQQQTAPAPQTFITSIAVANNQNNKIA